MTSLTEFLLARLADDEADPDRYADHFAYCEVVGCTCGVARERVKAQVEALRAVVAAIEEHREGEWEDDPIHEAVLHPLASVYRDHPDFDPSWLA